MESRLYYAAALPMPRLVTGQEAVADQLAQQNRASIPDEFVLIPHQDLLDQVGIVDKHQALVSCKKPSARADEPQPRKR